jgi:medium-chain acyl-[acyl-carrier-protein] hydrolase
MAFIQTDTYTVRGYETDATGKLSVPTLMNWMQESANRNALDYGIGMADLFRHGIGWMLMRFRLTLNRYPVYGDTVRVMTFPTSMEKYFIYRDFRLLSETGEVLAQAASTWITFNLERRTMVPLPDFIRQLQPPLVDNPLPPLPLKPGFAPPELPPRTSTRTIGWFDLDTNQHTNNVSYVQALIESMPEAHLRTSQLADLELFFKAESHLHEPLQVQTWLDAETGLHRLVHADDAREVLLARSVWEKNPIFAP